MVLLFLYYLNSFSQLRKPSVVISRSTNAVVHDITPFITLTSVQAYSGVLLQINGLDLYSAFLTTGASWHFTILSDLHPLMDTPTAETATQGDSQLVGSSYVEVSLS